MAMKAMLVEPGGANQRATHCARTLPPTLPAGPTTPSPCGGLLAPRDLACRANAAGAQATHTRMRPCRRRTWMAQSSRLRLRCSSSQGHANRDYGFARSPPEPSPVGWRNTPVRRGAEPAAAGTFDAHLRACDGCTNYVEQMARTLEIPAPSTSRTSGAAAEAVLLAAFRNWHMEGRESGPSNRHPDGGLSGSAAAGRDPNRVRSALYAVRLAGVTSDGDRCQGSDARALLRPHQARPRLLCSPPCRRSRRARGTS